jgi:hypothetical protein
MKRTRTLKRKGFMAAKAGKASIFQEYGVTLDQVERRDRKELAAIRSTRRRGTAKPWATKAAKTCGELLNALQAGGVRKANPNLRRALLAGRGRPSRRKHRWTGD